ncbi:helix-turn-helix transcriptional regulator [Paeniglutamicibacter sp. R2-26]|uniref:helix-turn-helix transcriptional regulator n=1 Tax=Paeniglutamicibacter sp. R2-26 TaxID=3144417 RepID=UPI003EE56555
MHTFEGLQATPTSTPSVAPVESVHRPLGDKIYSRAQAAEALGIKPSTLANLALAGGGPKFTRVGRMTIYLRADIEAYAEQTIAKVAA